MVWFKGERRVLICPNRISRVTLLYLSTMAVSTAADVQVTNVFETGEIIEAAEFNQNFADIEAGMLPDPADCATGSVAQWDGQSWACADDPLADQNCNDGDKLTFSTLNGWSCQ